MPDGIKIQAFTQEMLAEDTYGVLIGELARIAYSAFREPPWSDEWEMPRLHYGLGKDLMRRNARAYLARRVIGELVVVGYILGYEVFRIREDPRDLTLGEISGAEALDYLFEEGRRVFYEDTLCVDQDFRRQGIGEILMTALIEEVRGQGFNYFIGRTHVQANASRTLFIKLGFEELLTHDLAYPDRTYWLLRL